MSASIIAVVVSVLVVSGAVLVGVLVGAVLLDALAMYRARVEAASLAEFEAKCEEPLEHPSAPASLSSSSWERVAGADFEVRPAREGGRTRRDLIAPALRCALALLLLASGCGPGFASGVGEAGETGATSETGGETDGGGPGLPGTEVVPPGGVDPPQVPCGSDPCPVGYGCTIADTCVDCGFVAGVHGCACNIDGECESTSVCADGTCSAY